MGTWGRGVITVRPWLVAIAALPTLGCGLNLNNLDRCRYFTDFGKIAYQSATAIDGSWDGAASGSQNVWLMNMDGSQRTALTRNTAAGYSVTVPTYSPDGSRIAFSSQTALDGSWNGAQAGSSNIWIMKPDGTGRIALTKNSAAGYGSFSPMFSPDGTKIAFTSRTALDGSWNGTATLAYNAWVMDIDGNNRRPLTRNTTSATLDVFNGPIRFSPDGTKVIFHALTDLSGGWDGTGTQSYNVWTAKIDGSENIAITRNAPGGATHHSRGGVFAPGGSRIVFFSNTALDGSWNGAATTSSNIWTAKTDGTDRVALTLNTGAGYNSQSPVYTLDGRKILYASSQALDGSWNGTATGSQNIWISNPDGSSRMPLHYNTLAGYALNATLTSPGNDKILFTSSMALDGSWDGTGPSSANLFSMKIDGSSITSLTKNTLAGMNAGAIQGSVYVPAVCF